MKDRFRRFGGENTIRPLQQGLGVGLFNSGTMLLGSRLPELAGDQAQEDRGPALLNSGAFHGGDVWHLLLLLE